MNAPAKIHNLDTGDAEIDAAVDRDDLETLEKAKLEVWLQIALNSLQQLDLYERLGALESGAHEVRRRRARTTLPQPEPAIKFQAIFYDEELDEETPRAVLRGIQ
jgi:hypothetical protein